MKSRNANETILGYFYQFDKTIIEILKQTDDNNIITVEGIEDIDVEKTNEVETIQCKYHEALEYNNSSIKKAIILLLRNYVNNPQANYKYTLYAYFKSGNEKLKLPLNLDYLKSNFLEYKENGKEHKVYEELNVDNTNLEKFIKVLNIELIDTDYQEQKNNVIKLLPAFIISIVFTLTKWTYLSSFGMIMFWGIILIVVYNILVTRNIVD